jgi:mannose-6-phosphate isomerase
MAQRMPVHALTPRFLEKVWGSQHLSPWFPDSPLKIGEVWLEGPAGEPLPLLIKVLFTTGRLSVQVHPNDEYAWKHNQSSGKTEMWHILRAEDGARIALGLREALTPAQLRADSQSGEIEKKLNWIEVHPGDTFFVPAGTIHAIGGGIALCEIQQQSDVTYRLYDYGRPRELHLDQGIEVSYVGAYEPPPKPVNGLVECAYFRTECLVFDAEASVHPHPTKPLWLICIEGQGVMDGAAYRAGQAWQVDAGGGPPIMVLPASQSVFIKTLVP